MFVSHIGDIQLDFDKEQEYTDFILRFKHVRKNFPKVKRIFVFDTAHGKHIVLRTAIKHPDKDIVFYQAILNSDFRREWTNWDRVTHGKRGFGNSWNILFAKKWDWAGKEISREVRNKKEEKRLWGLYRTGKYSLSVWDWIKMGAPF